MMETTGRIACSLVWAIHIKYLSSGDALHPAGRGIFDMRT